MKQNKPETQKERDERLMKEIKTLICVYKVLIMIEGESQTKH